MSDGATPARPYLVPCLWCAGHGRPVPHVVAMADPQSHGICAACFAAELASLDAVSSERR